MTSTDTDINQLLSDLINNNNKSKKRKNNTYSTIIPLILNTKRPKKSKDTDDENDSDIYDSDLDDASSEDSFDSDSESEDETDSCDADSDDNIKTITPTPTKKHSRKQSIINLDDDNIIIGNMDKRITRSMINENTMDDDNEKEDNGEDENENENENNKNKNEQPAISKEDKLKKKENLKKYDKICSKMFYTGDDKYFKLLDIQQQKNIISKLNNIKPLISPEKSYRILILENEELPDKYKSIVLKKIISMETTMANGGDFSKIKYWIDTFIKIPFNKIIPFPVSKYDPIYKIHKFMDDGMKILNEAVYGLQSAKLQILQSIAKRISNPDSNGRIIALKGPMGVGKTSLFKNGIRKVLNLPFAFIPLGGVSDGSFLEGHLYTYEGSQPGKLIDTLIQLKCSNPVVYFDELDKVSKSEKGQEIIDILSKITDPTQNNSCCIDKYFSELNFDTSKWEFLFSYNDDTKISPILLDRFTVINISGYTIDEKIIIAQKHLIPSIENDVGIESGNIIISKELITYIIENYTKNEKGMRALKKCLESIYLKINMFAHMSPNTTINKIRTGDISFPYIVTNEFVYNIMLMDNVNNNSINPSIVHMYL